ncbi:hypothetical protein BS78_06G034400 [Paspalum vaginatum]|nr:hypothetical protein BS78_06G034400 [Paspalum vaginatum]
MGGGGGSLASSPAMGGGGGAPPLWHPRRRWEEEEVGWPPFLSSPVNLSFFASVLGRMAPWWRGEFHRPLHRVSPVSMSSSLSLWISVLPRWISLPSPNPASTKPRPKQQQINLHPFLIVLGYRHSVYSACLPSWAAWMLVLNTSASALLGFLDGRRWTITTNSTPTFSLP